MDWTQLEQLRVTGFTMTRRGYDTREVDRFLDSLAEWLETDAANELGDQAVQRKLELVGQVDCAHPADDREGVAGAAAHDRRPSATTCARRPTPRRRTRVARPTSTRRRTARRRPTSTRRTSARRPTRRRSARRTPPTEQARKTVEEGDRRRAAAEAVVAELKAQRDATVAELERLRGELLSTISKHTTRSAPEPRSSEGRRKRANIAKAPAEEKTEALEPAEVTTG